MPDVMALKAPASRANVAIHFSTSTCSPPFDNLIILYLFKKLNRYHKNKGNVFLNKKSPR